MIKNGIEIIQCRDKKEASKKASELLLRSVDQDTLLFLSGGTSPVLLYQLIARDKTLKPGVVALVDERFGPPMHANSNEKMIYESSLLEYLNSAGIPFYGILKEGDMGNVAEQYEKVIKDLSKKYSKKVAIMGVGADGHTASIKPGLDYDNGRLVVAYNDINGRFGKRITLTFEALDEVDEFIILIFGENKQSSSAAQTKKEMLIKMFQEQDAKSLPAVFYAKISAKVTILTDIDLSS